MVYGGMPFTTDFGVVDRLRAGEDVEVEELHDALPPFFRQVAHAGGLLHYGNAWLSGELQPWYGRLPSPPLAAVPTSVQQ